MQLQEPHLLGMEGNLPKRRMRFTVWCLRCKTQVLFAPIKQVQPAIDSVSHGYQEAIDALKPGVHWDSIQHQCHVTLVKGFIALGIFIGSEDAIMDAGISSAFFPHGVGE